MTHPCDACPARDISETSKYGYCEGCPSRLRKCAGCREFKAQTGWGYGTLFGGLVRWVCAECRFPAPPDVRQTYPQFVAKLGLAGSEQVTIAYELDRAADRNNNYPVVDLLRRMSKSIVADGGIDIDASDFGLEDRQALLLVIRQIPGNVPAVCYPAADRLRRAWGDWLADQTPEMAPPPPAPTVAQRMAALGLEKEIDDA